MVIRDFHASSAQCECVCVQEGEESYPLYKKEKDGLLQSLTKRAKMIEEVSFVKSHIMNSGCHPPDLCIVVSMCGYGRLCLCKR